jgi:phosphoserine phosphatase RsbU/P
MQYKSSERLKITTFKLNSLLSITQAINENLPVPEMLSRYQNILHQDLNIGKILIFKHNYKWECILKSGFSDEALKKINVERDLLPFSDITFITSAKHLTLETADIVIPVYNNNAPLAFVLIGDIDEEGQGISPTIKHLHFIQTISNIIIVAIENIRLFQESLRQEALKKELELASKMQNMLIPDVSTLPKTEHIHFTAFYYPHMNVGGDYYDVIQLNDDEIGFCIADVSGKGISAALLMSNFQANLRALFTADISLEVLIEKLNVLVMKSAKGEKFITIFTARYNQRTKELQYINAAHNPPVLYDLANKTSIPLTNGCVGIGMLDEIPTIKKGVLVIKNKSKLLCYTDGLIELIDEKNITNATVQVEAHIANDESIENNIQKIIEDQKIHSENPCIFDDVTMLGVEFY